MRKTNQPALGYDIIGDIHGHAQELASLLDALGYKQSHGHYAHPENRKVIYLGDYIDRGPQIRAVLETVRCMVDGGSALAILVHTTLASVATTRVGKSLRNDVNFCGPVPFCCGVGAKDGKNFGGAGAPEDAGICAAG